MENWLLSDKEKNIEIDWLIQNSDQLFELIASLLKSKDEKILSKICTKITNLYKETDVKNQNLVINCLPILLNYYFNYYYDEKFCSIVEVCVLTIYNLSLSDENVKLNKIRIPNLSTQSVYHSPQVSAIQFELSESAMSKYESEYVIQEEQFKPYLETINTEKRFNMIKFLLLLYYSRLANATKSSKSYFCDMCLKICKVNRLNVGTQPIYLNSNILIEMLHILFYLFNNNLQLDAYIAIEAITVKAEEELLFDVILICNTIKNLIQQSKIEPAIQSALNAYDSNSSISNNAGQHKNSFSIRKKSHDSSIVVNQNIKMGNDSPSASPKSGFYLLNSSDTKNSLSDVYVSPSGEIRTAAKRASVKIQQQQQQQIQQAEEFSVPPTPPKTSPPLLHAALTNIESDEIESIPVIDETSGEGLDEFCSNHSFKEKF